MTNQQLDQLAINTIRTLSTDAVQQAKSGPSSSSRTTPWATPDKRVFNQDAMPAAREKQKQIKERFRSWVFADPERTERLLAKDKKDDGLVFAEPGDVAESATLW